MSPKENAAKDGRETSNLGTPLALGLSDVLGRACCRLLRTRHAILLLEVQGAVTKRQHADPLTLAAGASERQRYADVSLMTLPRRTGDGENWTQNLGAAGRQQARVTPERGCTVAKRDATGCAATP
jgi:hypothetical protein